MSLNPEFKAKWVAALRSGQYTQCTGQLNSGGSHCCLGIARDACGVSKDTGDSAGYLLNKKEIAAVGLTASIQRTLYRLNDRDGKSFAEIADYIEAHL